jgi:hypothetical protein
MKKLMGILLGCVVLFGCSLYPSSLVFDKETFDQQRAAWEAQGTKGYSVVEAFSSNNYGYLKGRIVVEDNIIVLKENLDEWVEAQYLDDPRYVPIVFGELITVSELYADIARRYEYPGEIWKIEVLYNEKFYYPEWVVYSFKGHPGLIGTGGSDTIELTEFKLLPEN